MGALERDDYYYDKLKSEMSVYEYNNFIRHQCNPRYRFELCDGYIVMMAGGATPNHHRISGFIFSAIHQYLKGKKCEVFQDINVYLFDGEIGKCENAFQPDVAVCCDKSKFTNTGYEGVPLFVVEVISLSTARHDYIVKLEKYMRYGVKEYWIVDLFKNQILVYINEGNGIPKPKRLSFDEKIKISVFEDISIDFPELFRILYEDENFEDSLN
jgi:Uma2 family endonuclease